MFTLPPLRGEKDCGKGCDCKHSKCKIDIEGFVIIAGSVLSLMIILGVFAIYVF